MISNRDGHVRVLPIHVANKIAAGEVVERPASIVKELVENAIDAGAKSIRVTISAGGRKLVSVQDDGIGMTRDDAVLALERQATSKILDVTDIEQIDTLGFRGEAIPSIASVSRFSLTTRRHEADEGTFLQVNAGTLAEVRAAGCPPGTLVEVRDLFCNVPARRKFLKSFQTEETHVRSIFTIHALAHPAVGFTLIVDGRELYRLAPAGSLSDRVRDIFGSDFLSCMLPLDAESNDVRISGFVERPNLSTPTRREQYVFVNGRPATAPSIAYALREAYPRRAGDVRPATILFLDLPAAQVDVNVHPTKREVRFRDNARVKNALEEAISKALSVREPIPAPPVVTPTPAPITPVAPTPAPILATKPIVRAPIEVQPKPEPTPVPLEFALDEETTGTKPWAWFKFLAQSASGYLLIETDSGIVTINPLAARERIVFERLLRCSKGSSPNQANVTQQLLIPEIVQLSPVEAGRLANSMDVIREMGFQLEPFGTNTLKVDAVPQIIGTLSPASVLQTIACDLEGGARRDGARWKEERIAKSIARSFAGAPLRLNESGAAKLVEDLCSCRMPYVCPRGKPVMIFTSTRELDRKFDRL